MIYIYLVLKTLLMMSVPPSLLAVHLLLSGNKLETQPYLYSLFGTFVQLELAQPPSLMLEEAKSSKIKAKKSKKAEVPPETDTTSPASNIEGKVYQSEERQHAAIMNVIL